MTDDFKHEAIKVLENLGGSKNISILENCLTRLRVKFVDKNLINEEEINKIGSVLGIVYPSENTIHIIIGQKVIIIAEEIRKML